MGKRKIQEAVEEPAASGATLKKKKSKSVQPSKKNTAPLVPETIQIIAGSYDRILHGISATTGPKEEADFADTFLFSAHTAAIRCVAVSAPSAPIRGQTQKVFLASGSADERINVYNLSAHPPSRKNQDLLAKVAPRPILENPKNRELGTLLHHASTITALRFPTRSKLLSASEDSTIAVTRTRDWNTLSTIKAPIPKAFGRPSGDTAPFGGTPSGVNDFAIHPSMKLMISVSKAERCMRLWNLVTGKKAGVLNFDREMLQEAGEGKHSTGEGRTLVWGNVDGADEFAVGFDRDIVVFGMDSVPKCRVMPGTGSGRPKIHKFEFVEVSEEVAVMAVATDDGRIAFFSTRADDLTLPGEAPAPNTKESTSSSPPKLAIAKPLGYVGGKAAGVEGRVKDFLIIKSTVNKGLLYAVGGSSDGKVRVWRVDATTLEKAALSSPKEKPEPIGSLLGTYETQNRITCVAAYLMIPRPDGLEDSEDESEESEEEEASSEEDE